MLNEEQKRIMATLEKLAGGQFDQDNIERGGTQIRLPDNMEVGRAISLLTDYEAAQEKVLTFNQTYEYRFLDGLIALKRTLRKLTGFDPTQKTYRSIFGEFTPPSLRVQVGLNEWEEAPTGEFPVLFFDGMVQPYSANHDTFGTVFALQIKAPKKYTAQVQAFFLLVGEELGTNSIYRGKAITAAEEPTFLDVGSVKEKDVVYSEEVLTQLNANVWSLLTHTDAMRENRLPLKRSVLFAGPYGTGKTLGAYRTAQIAEANGWTFIFAKPGEHKLTEALTTARLYQPAVVFFEDVDTTTNADMDVSSLLDVFDGIETKGTEIVAIFTTNHADKLHKGLMRPGRLDAVITIGALDKSGIEKMIRGQIDARWLPSDLDMDSISLAMDGFMPAFVKEAIDRAKRYALARNDGQLRTLSSQDFVDAANGLRPQFELMEGAAEFFQHPTVDTALREVVETVLTEHAVLNLRGDQLPLVEKERTSV